MTAARIISEVKKTGLSLIWDGKNLRVKGRGQLPIVLRKEIRANKENVIRMLSTPPIRGQRVHTVHGRGVMWEYYPNLDRIGVILDGDDWPRFMPLADVSLARDSSINGTLPCMDIAPDTFESLALYAKTDASEPAQVFRRLCLGLRRISELYEALPTKKRTIFDDTAFNPRTVAEVEEWEIAWLEALRSGRNKCL